MSVLVTGGAGYIGSHLVRLLRERGDDVVVVDDLSQGFAARVGDVPLVVLDLADPGSDLPLRAVLREHSVTAVVHFAARKRVPESVERPAWYYRENVGGLATLLMAMTAEGVDRLVFSSSAAVYGTTEGPAIREDDPTVPVNPYGDSKLIGERMITAQCAASPLRATALRYFNVAGTGWDDLADVAVLNLVPMMFERIDAGEAPVVFGDDYPTPDGTCVRDYVHVMDLAQAHLVALDALGRRNPGMDVLNVGTGRGTSVREMIEILGEIVGDDIQPRIAPRRLGDPAFVVADASLIRERLDWVPRHDVRDMIGSAWRAHLRPAADSDPRG